MTQIEAKCPECDKLAWDLTISCPSREIPVAGEWMEFEKGPTTYLTFRGVGPDGRVHELDLSFATDRSHMSSPCHPSARPRVLGADNDEA